MKYRIKTIENKTYISPIALYDEQQYYYAISQNNGYYAIYRNGKYQNKGASDIESAKRLLNRLNNTLEPIQAIY